nr:fructosamine kinase family protein [Pseudonocardia endophytica]
MLGVGVHRVSGRSPARVELDDGRTVVAKNGAADPGSVPAEAAGLRWLAVPDGPPVPDVLADHDEWLVTTLVPSGSPSSDAAADLGRRLAALHANGADAFGSAPPGGPELAWIGRARMRNVPTDRTWAEWYATDRIEPYVRAAGGQLDTAVFDDVMNRLPELAGPDEPPARLHGDLWSGNVLWSPDGAWLVDPAAHGGHRETDLAMLDLFGLPHLATVLAAYDETAPLADGWRTRVPLHQLFPLLVHTVLFGGGYAGQADAAARAALRT